MSKRSKILLSITTISILSAILYWFGFFTPYNFISANSDLLKGRLRILKYGEAFKTDQLSIELASKNGFEYDIVAGCLITTPEINGIEAYNLVMRNAIKKKLGKEWERKFQQEVDSLYLSQQLVEYTCIHNDLSKAFDFSSYIKRIKRTDAFDSCFVIISISDKTKSKRQAIPFSSNFFFEDVFKNCNAVRSFITEKNKNLKVADNDYGDLIVADLNFDQREDIAIKGDSGGNGGPSYNFYLQSENGQFILDKFLTDSMIFFPADFETKSKILTTYVHANAYQAAQHKFKYFSNSNLWKQISHTLINDN